MTLVVDAGVVVAALVGRDGSGARAVDLMRANDLVAPHLMPAEVANALRNAVARGWLPPDDATDAHDELLHMSVELFGYTPLASRVWELRDTVTAYDAWYVALAETLGARLATADARLSRAPGPRCEFLVIGD